MVNWKMVLGFYGVLFLTYLLLMWILSQFSGYTLMDNMRDTTLVFAGSIFGSLCYSLWEKAFVK